MRDYYTYDEYAEEEARTTQALKERDEARATVERLRADLEWQGAVTKEYQRLSDDRRAKIEAALALNAFPRFGDHGHRVVWRDQLVEALKGEVTPEQIQRERDEVERKIEEGTL